VRILHVLHDFLPNHVAGVEVYTDHLTRRQAKEHEVALLFSEVVPAAADYSLRRGVREGVRTFELVNNHRLRRFEETYRNAAVDRRVREVLDEFRPDVVHVQHLLNLSIELVPELRRRRIPVVMTLHDHWLACANGGQRFHRDLGRCNLLDAARCAGCTAHLNGSGLGARAILRWREADARRVQDVLELVDVPPAAAEAPRPEFVYLDLHSYGVGRRAWVAHPPARLLFRIQAESGGTFLSEVAMHPDTFEAEGGGVRFSVSVDGELGADRVLDPKRRPEDRLPASVRVELPPRRSRLELRTQAVPPDRSDHCTAAWVNPRVIATGASVRPATRLGRGIELLARGGLRLRSAAQERRIRQRWEAMRALGREVDLFLAPSRFLAAELVRFGLPEERVLHCDYGFDTEGFRRRTDLPDRCRRFTFIGSPVRHKGVHVLLDAFRGMPEDATLEVNGPLHYDPTYSEVLRRRAAHPGIRFAGVVAPERVPEVLSRVDCLVVPSIWQENSPLTIHEAFLAGVPVVASRLGGCVELLAGGGGLLYDADDPAQLRATLRRLYDEPGLGRRLAASAPAVKTMPDHAAELLGIYERLRAGRGDARALA
jgi:glycosyltransferase involved in cell wall biosynthesis